jgi:DNA-binding beta-propeller fold protein YncE
MNFTSVFGAALTAAALTCTSPVWASQAPGSLSAPDIPISHHDRVYSADQFSNTVSVIDPTR